MLISKYSDQSDKLLQDIHVLVALAKCFVRKIIDKSQFNALTSICFGACWPGKYIEANEGHHASILAQCVFKSWEIASCLKRKGIKGLRGKSPDTTNGLLDELADKAGGDTQREIHAPRLAWTELMVAI
ncbi:TPA: hypothetical protein ACTXXA_001274 [Legionella anisa]